MDNIFHNPVSKLFLIAPLLYEIDVVITCPCSVILSCYQTEFFTALLVTFGIATIILTFKIGG